MIADTYPDTITAKDDRAYVLRPIQREDAPSLMRGYDALSDRGKWFRMLHAVPHLTDEMAQKFCAPDPETEVCLVVEGKDDLAQEILGGARMANMKPGEMAEFSVSFRPEARGLGLARKSLQAVIEIARQRGASGVVGFIAAHNDAMRGLADRLGMQQRRDPDDFSMILAELSLAETQKTAA